ncbi:hypothetical protein ACFU6K_13385 [Kitasatospora sp. NPDC057512]|uniref:hypothetical protein n=1 Tax=Kitasatospora sp. NPDC057512 TaxID=3346154 RepID=UPI00369CD9A0
MLRTRLAQAAAVVTLAVAAALPAVALSVAGHETASVSRVEAADVHDENMIWQ